VENRRGHLAYRVGDEIILRHHHAHSLAGLAAKTAHQPRLTFAGMGDLICVILTKEEFTAEIAWIQAQM
jgi:hypothetical protein